MLSPETSKRRSARNSLDYFRRGDRLTRARMSLSAAASVATIAWLGGLGWDVREWSRRAERSRALASHGPLARSHAAIETACDRCHVPFTPIDGSGWASRFVSDARASDRKCRECHAGARHQAAEEPGEVASCASCHLDHRGRDASMIVMADRNCTRCHAETERHLRPGFTTSFASSVTRFDSDESHHPEFALFRDGPARDPGRLKFDHLLHMSPGFTVEPGGRPIKTLADLPAADREAYRAPGQSDADPVRLRCDSCHQPEADRRSAPGASGGAGGAYMRPIRFEKDCRACHTLDFDPDLPPVRHGLQPPEVVEALWQSYASEHLRDRPAPDVDESPLRPGPEGGDRRSARGAIGERVALASRILFGEKKCGECHAFESPDGRENSPITTGSRIAPTRVPDHWFRHATFNHSSHRTARCQDCHSRAFPEDPAPSRSSLDVMIPSVAVCRSCHAPTRAAPGGTTSGCTDCHRYHNGDGPRKVADPIPMIGRLAPGRESPEGVPAGYRRGDGGSSNHLLRWLERGEDAMPDLSRSRAQAGHDGGRDDGRP